VKYAESWTVFDDVKSDTSEMAKAVSMGICLVGVIVYMREEEAF